jgi:hypothetical protein
VRVDLGATDASNIVPDEFKAGMVTVSRDRVTATDAGQRAVLDAIPDTGTNTLVTRMLTAIIVAVAPDDAARSALEGLMVTKEYKNDFFDRAEAIGEAKAKAKVLVKILNVRAIDLTSEQSDLILSCTDSAQLDRWVDRALVATSADEVFKD